MPIMQTRRRFLSTLSLAGAAGLVRPPAVFGAEGRLETTSVRLAKMPDMCMAPQLVAQELLREEGFTDVQYIDTTNDQLGKAVAAHNVDLTLTYIQQALGEIDRGSPITMVAGIMVGCVEVFAQGVGATTENFKKLTVHGTTSRGRSRWFAEKGYAEQLAAFLGGIRDRKPPAVTVYDGARATIACLRMLESARTLRPCDLGPPCGSSS